MLVKPRPFLTKVNSGCGLVNILRSISQNAKNDILAWIAFTASLQQRLNHTAKLCLRIVIISPQTSSSSPQGLISLKEQGAIWSARRAENGEGYGFTGVI
jgi:hypothetical protein